MAGGVAAAAAARREATARRTTASPLRPSAPARRWATTGMPHPQAAWQPHRCRRRCRHRHHRRRHRGRREPPHTCGARQAATWDPARLHRRQRRGVSRAVAPRAMSAALTLRPCSLRQPSRLTWCGAPARCTRYAAARQAAPACGWHAPPTCLLTAPYCCMPTPPRAAPPTCCLARPAPPSCPPAFSLGTLTRRPPPRASRSHCRLPPRWQT